MNFPNNYKILVNWEHIQRGPFNIRPVRYSDRYKIMNMRNKNRSILRTKRLLTRSNQDLYFREELSNEFESELPKTILLSLFYEGSFAAYGGLVHINWKAKVGELSYLTMDSEVEPISNFNKLCLDFFVKEVAILSKTHLMLENILTETFKQRTTHMRALEAIGFRKSKLLWSKIGRKLNVGSIYHKLTL